jgi:hypothetical protein
MGMRHTNMIELDYIVEEANSGEGREKGRTIGMIDEEKIQNMIRKE